MPLARGLFWENTQNSPQFLFLASHIPGDLQASTIQVRN
jgi:hypothetical protein